MFMDRVVALRLQPIYGRSDHFTSTGLRVYFRTRFYNMSPLRGGASVYGKETVQLVSDPIYFEELQPRLNKIWEAFQRKWKRFQFFVLDPGDPKFQDGLQTEWPGDVSLLQKARTALNELTEIRNQMLGKKSELATVKKMIGLVDQGH